MIVAGAVADWYWTRPSFDPSVKEEEWTQHLEGARSFHGLPEGALVSSEFGLDCGRPFWNMAAKLKHSMPIFVARCFCSAWKQVGFDVECGPACFGRPAHREV